MVQILHARATTTHSVRKKIRESKKSVRALAKEYNINAKTVMKWKHRETSNDNAFGPKKLRTILTPVEEKIICVFRKSTNFALDDCYISLKETIPNLSRSNLHRCLKRNGLSILPKEEKIPREKQKFKDCKIGYFHIDITEIRLGKPKLYLFVAIDRISKLAFAKLYLKQTVENSIDFLQKIIDDCPYKIHTILTDNGAQFTYNFLNRNLRPKNHHQFDIVCKKHFIRHKTIKFRHPWTNGQVEIFNKIIKNATTKVYHYDNIEQLEKHLQEFLLAYNFAKKLKSIKFKTPLEFLIEEYRIDASLFYRNPCHYLGGLNKTPL
jgi:transposase-like protein